MTHTRIINGIKVTAYNDSGIDWVVQAEGMTAQRIPKKTFTMLAAMTLMSEVAATNNKR